MEFNIIVAIDSLGGIGKNGGVPWENSTDEEVRNALRRDRVAFRQHTANGTLIMGRATWESLPVRPLPGRLNIVITSSGDVSSGDVIVVDSFESALAHATRGPVSVIGGERVYAEALAHPMARMCIVTRIPGEYNCDRVFPGVDRCWESDGSSTVYSRVNRDETAYLDVLAELLRAPLRPNRTGIPTRSVFTRTLRFQLADRLGRMTIPLLTTKRVAFRVVAEELLWFIRGSWDVRELQARNVHIWDGNSTREYLDGRGLTRYREGEVGMQYGMQWRHWGAEYVPECDRAPGFAFGGIDQLQRVIDGIRRDPWSRRHIVTSWNVADLPKMALPPCHIQYQWYVDPDDTGAPAWLSCHLTQRSGDYFLGVNFNAVSVSLLTHMIAEVCGLRAREAVITIVDCHLYENHEEAARTQLARTPRGFPRLVFSDRVAQRKKDDSLTIDDWSVDDFKILDYHPFGVIKAPMAV